jgi:phosphatidate cytidylyltransferase
MTSLLSNLNNLQQRAIAAVVGVSIILGSIFYSDWSFFILFCAISVLTQLEFYKLLGLNGNQPLTYYGTATGVIINTLVFLIEKGELPSVCYYLVIPMVASVFFIKLYKKKDLQPFLNIAFTFLGIIYVALPFAFLIGLSLKAGYYNYEIVIGCLFLLWASDIGAYFAGTRYGKRKLFERVSPKKSWEGFMGGALFAALVSAGLSHYFKTYEPWQWYCIATIMVVCGTLGDLVESLFKRSISIKDSGNSIPGHGGFLDRFDGLLLSMPFIITFVKLFS